VNQSQVGRTFKSHFSVEPIEYRVLSEVNGYFHVESSDGDVRIMDARILKSLLRSAEAE
jgi:hypothetical protein